MSLSEHEVTQVREVWLSHEVASNPTDEPRPTLWDPENRPRHAMRAVWLVGPTPNVVEIHTDPKVVAAYLDGDSE